MDGSKAETKKDIPENMTLSVVIISYNVKSFLRQCLKSILASKNIDSLEIVVVDNYSFDGSNEMLKVEFPQVKLIQNDKNLGFSKAVNKGIEKSTGDYICLINPDSLIKDDTLSKLHKYMVNNTDTGIAGCKVLDADGSLQLASRRKFPTPLVALPRLLGLSKLFPKSKLFGQYNQTFMDDSVIQEVDAVSGSCMMFPKKLVDEIGDFDERFFMYFEDTDFCFRAKKAGYKVIYNPETQIIHYKGESLKHAPFDVIDTFHNAMIQFFKKHSSEFPLWRFLKILIYSAIGLRKITEEFRKYASTIISTIFDIFSVSIAFISAIAVWYPYNYNEPVTIKLIIGHWPLYLTFVLFWILVSVGVNLYRKNYLSYGGAIVVSILTFLLASSITYLVSIFAYSRAVITFASVFTALLTAFWRISVHMMFRYKWLKIFHLTPFFTRRALIIGSDNESLRIGNLITQTPEADFDLIGFVDDSINAEISDNRFLGRTEDLGGIVESQKINEIILPEKSFSTNKVIDLIQRLAGSNVIFKFVPDGEHHLIGKGIIENLGGVPLLDIEFPLFNKVHLVSKRMFDIIFSFVSILITLPIHLFFLVLFKVEKRTIWSANNQSCRILQYKTSNQFVSELPILFSILRGKISFVGGQVVDFEQADPNLLIKPGITGLSQLKPNKIDENMYHSFDQYYIQNHSFIFDLEILLKSLLRI
ncbi:MAG: glycosyltransferase [Candidatus Marinimicrobia bacterium]|nr:glycosyltransferase [Candidatus Neomarinimicrobiota bacterium]MBL7022723.1 glycosyltransferase [Candidatus Neomarinimicrobiota bacterium]MBL7109148.1 glycosyltransferase [Candidatus Neomarinimicrobiota bacterium]